MLCVSCMFSCALCKLHALLRLPLVECFLSFALVACFSACDQSLMHLSCLTSSALIGKFWNDSDK